VKFRTIPPDPAELPRIKLVWPAAIPTLILLVAWAAQLSGYAWNIHGDGALLVVCFFLSLLVGVVASLLTLASVIPALKTYPTLRSRVNLACTGFAVIFTVTASAYLVAGIVKAIAV
jgi:hypothetical protein